MPHTRDFTAQEIFEKACSYLSQTAAESAELAVHAPRWLDTLVTEALPYENMRRRYEMDPARPELLAAPEVKKLSDVIPYDDEICRVALPYGLASQFFIDDDEEYRAQDFRGRFVSALSEVMRVREKKIVDVY